MATIYIGPSIKDLDLRKNRIYREYPAEKIQTLNRQNGLIERLFVSVENLIEAEKDLATKGTPENLAYASFSIRN